MPPRKLGRRGRRVGKPATAVRKSSTTSMAAGTTPSWKPAKSSVTGNYGKAVSAAAHSRNAARKTPIAAVGKSSTTTSTNAPQIVGGTGLRDLGLEQMPQVTSGATLSKSKATAAAYLPKKRATGKALAARYMPRSR